MTTDEGEVVARVLENARLEAEVAPARQEAFETKYESITGVRPTLGEDYQLQQNKFGVEGRVYFNATDEGVAVLREAGYYVTETSDYRGEYRYRINNNDLFWELIRRGLELGNN